MGDYPKKISLPAAIQYLCRAFNEFEGLHISFDHSSKGRKFHPPIVSGVYQIIHDLFNFFALIGTSGQLKVQLVEKRNGLLLLVGLKQHTPRNRPSSPDITGIIKQVKLLRGEITIDLAPDNEFNITIDIPDHYSPIANVDKPVRVLIADDHPAMRDCLSSILGSEDNLIVVGLANNGREAIDWVKNNQIDLVLMDISMPEVNGIEATKYITRHFPAVKVLAITMHLEDHYISEMIKAGALGYISKASGKTTLLEAIKNVVAGVSYVLN